MLRNFKSFTLILPEVFMMEMWGTLGNKKQETVSFITFYYKIKL